PVTRTTSKSSARVIAKCSHNAVDVSTPASASSRLSNGTHDPQPVPARVHDLMAATSVHPPVVTASTTVAFVTLWQLHTIAESGNAPPAGVAPSAASSNDCGSP